MRTAPPTVTQELKKLRTQRRLAREQEKQELIRQGLLEPPAPKVRISNLARVLGEEAAADPTAIEAEVRRQMEERAAAHADRNLARKLTPAEARDKKLKKLVGDAAAEPTTTVALYKVRAWGGEGVGCSGAWAGGRGAQPTCDRGATPPSSLGVFVSGSPARPRAGLCRPPPCRAPLLRAQVASLARPQLKFKVSINAQELHMTGVGLSLEDGVTLVVVEGPDKAQRRSGGLSGRRRVCWHR